MPDITASTVVMTPSPANGPSSLWITFEYKNTDGYITRSTMLPRSEWEALGSPEELTVTIVPGNTLEV